MVPCKLELFKNMLFESSHLIKFERHPLGKKSNIALDLRKQRFIVQRNQTKIYFLKTFCFAITFFLVSVNFESL